MLTEAIEGEREAPPSPPVGAARGGVIASRVRGEAEGGERPVQPRVEALREVRSEEVELLRPRGRATTHADDPVTLRDRRSLGRDRLPDHVGPQALDGPEERRRR